ncbi:MAG: hypothetical protein J6W75_09300 [Bacteroidaceae bacterium]|nr:hypothetical protein [Bacteroidaceae bacterium]
MKPTQQTLQQIERAIRKVTIKFPQDADAVLTDIHLQVKPDSGELLAFDDEMNELTRIVVDQWLEPTEEDLYQAAATIIKQVLGTMREELEHMSILRPYSFVLMGEDQETICDLYLVDDDNLILDTELLKGLDKELDEFLAKLMKDN